MSIIVSYSTRRDEPRKDHLPNRAKVLTVEKDEKLPIGKPQCVQTHADASTLYSLCSCFTSIAARKSTFTHHWLLPTSTSIITVESGDRSELTYRSRVCLSPSLFLSSSLRCVTVFICQLSDGKRLTTTVQSKH